MPGGSAEEENSYLDKFDQLPDVVQDYLLDEKAADAIIKIASDFRLSDSQKDELVNILGDASVKILALAELRNKIESFLALPLDISKNVFLEALGNYFLPLNDFFNEEVSRLIEANGGRVKNYPDFRVVLKKETAKDATQEIARKFFDLLKDESLRVRLADVIESRLRGVRTDNDFRDILIRGTKVGGLELEQNTADEIVDDTAEKMRSVKIISETEASSEPRPVLLRKEASKSAAVEPFNAQIRKEPEIKPIPAKPLVKTIDQPLAPAAVLPKVLPREIKKEESKPFPPRAETKIVPPEEVKKAVPPPAIKFPEKPIAPKIAPAPVTPVEAKKMEIKPAPPRSEIKIEPPKEAKKAVPVPATKFPEKSVAPKIYTKPIPAAVEAASPVVQQLPKPLPRQEKPAVTEQSLKEIPVKKDLPPPLPAVKKISKDISEAELEREIQHIKHDQMPKVELTPMNFEEIAIGIINQSQIIVNPEEKGRLKTIITARLKDIRDGQETKDILSRDYSFGGMGFTEVQVGVIMPIIEKEFGKISEQLRAGAEEKIAKDRRAEEERKRKVAEEGRYAEEQSFDKRFIELTGDKVRRPIPVSLPRVLPGTPVVSSPAQSGKPKVQDIKYEPKLVGPVDEISRLTLTDFRRLGANAKEAVAKIKDKIEAMKLDSIKKWQEGVAAWNGGEVNKLYLQIFGEALQNKKSLKDVSAERDAAKTPSLREDEINAIMELNKSLRF